MAASTPVKRQVRTVARMISRCGSMASSERVEILSKPMYVKNTSDWEEYNRLYREYFTPPYPARTTLTGCLGKVLYEIDVIAVVE